jgi:hypothetical protein
MSGTEASDEDEEAESQTGIGEQHQDHPVVLSGR